MLKSEIQDEINRLYRQLDSFEQSRKKAIEDKRELTYAIDEINKKSREIEDGLRQTIDTIEEKLSKINQRSRFPEMYRNAAKKIIFGVKSENALMMTKESIQNGKKKCLEIDDEIEYYSWKVEQTKNEIEALRYKMNEAVE